MELRAAVAPTVLAGERALPTHPALAALLPGGLVRGRTVGCRGPGATSLALALMAEAAAAGAWLAVIDVPEVGIEAAAEHGVPLERLVRVDGPPARRAATWADLVRVSLDGFELVLTRPPGDAGEALLHRVRSQVQARGAVLVALGTRMRVDVVLDTAGPVWEGPEAGYGRLAARRLDVQSGGRRVPRSRHACLWLPAANGGIAAASDVEPIEPARGEYPELHAVG